MRTLAVLAAATGFALAVAAPAGAVGSPWDTTFGGDGMVTTDFGANDVVGDVVVQPDGKIVVVGTRGGDFGVFAVARYNTDGSFDTSFSGDGKAENGAGSGTGSQAHAVALQPDGKIVVAGNACGLFGCDFHLQRYNSDGSLDPTFSGDGIVGVGVGGLRGDTAYALAIRPDGKIVAAGDTCEPPIPGAGFDCDWAIMRFNADGSMDGAFNGTGIVVDQGGGVPGGVVSGTMHLRGVAIGASNEIVAAGWGNVFAADGGGFSIGRSRVLVARYQATGAPLGMVDEDFGTPFLSFAAGFARQADGRLVVAGTGIELIGPDRGDLGVLRLNADLTRDGTFGVGGRLLKDLGATEDGADVALASDGGIVVAGTSGALGHLVRYTPGGALDPGFNGDGRLTETFPAHAMAIAPDGKIVVAGTLAGDFAVARFVADGGDGTAPVLSLPGTVVAEATSAAGAAVAFAATATDAVDPSPDVACSPASGSTFALGETTVTCTATDDVGNRSTGSFVVRVQDTTPPEILAGTIRVKATSAAGAVVTYFVIATDAVDPAPELECVPPQGSLFPIGTTVVACSATDSWGNPSEESFRVIVVGFREELDDLIGDIGALPLTGQADVRRDSAQQFCVNASGPANWASNGMPRTNDAGRYALLQIRQCVLYLMGPPAEVQTASAAIRLALIDLVCRIAHARYAEVSAASGANASRLVQAKTSLDQADAMPGTNEALFDCVSAWSILRNEPPQYTT